MREKITDTFVITKRFRSPKEFGNHIEAVVINKKMTYIDAVILYCSEVGIDVESVNTLIDRKLKQKIRTEAEQANMISTKTKKRAS